MNGKTPDMNGCAEAMNGKSPDMNICAGSHEYLRGNREYQDFFGRNELAWVE
jgi:hypothetical protein